MLDFVIKLWPDDGTDQGVNKTIMGFSLTLTV